MTNLKLLEITNVKSTDKSLSALAELKNLNELLIANFFPMEEFARLSIKLPNTKCTWFKPYVPIESFECKNCGSNSMVMLTGKGKSIICSICNSNKLNKHLDDWEKIIKETV